MESLLQHVIKISFFSNVEEILIFFSHQQQVVYGILNDKDFVKNERSTITNQERTQM